MNDLSRRIQRLEAQRPGSGRVIVIGAHRSLPSAAIDPFLARQEVVRRPSDLVVVVRRFAEQQEPRGPDLVSITDMSPRRLR